MFLLKTSNNNQRIEETWANKLCANVILVCLCFANANNLREYCLLLASLRCSFSDSLVFLRLLNSLVSCALHVTCLQFMIYYYVLV